MSIRVDIKRTDFYNELSKEKREEFFNATGQKFLPAIDNIYYSLYVKGDHRDNEMFNELINDLKYFKRAAVESRKLQEYFNGLYVDWKSFAIYKYCLTNPDFYDIFVLENLTNDNTPRIHIQLRAYGLWLHGAEKMIEDSYNHAAGLFAEFVGAEIEICRENRVDYCYHTNAIQRPERIFKDNMIEKYVSSTLELCTKISGMKHREDGRLKLNYEYCAFGNPGGLVYVRCYNKGMEVIAEGYKGYFFELWQQEGVISYYDRYCLELAFLERNYDYIHKARLLFYLEHGTQRQVKREFELSLADDNLTYQKIKQLADAYMPEITTVFNVEYQTMRRFYYYSDEFIDAFLKTAPREGMPEPLVRIYKIIDNRKVFLDYLTSTTLCFRRIIKEFGKKDKYEYAAWWERLRNTKLGGLNADKKLIRDYSSRLDKKIIQKRFVSSVASSAVYDGKVETGFIEDLSDVLSSINDNDVQRAEVFDGNLEMFASEILKDYGTKKKNAFKRIKNRIDL